MAAEIKVGVGADVSGLEKGLDQGKKAIIVFDKSLGQLQSQLKSLENGLKSASNSESFARIQRGISATKDKINQFNTAAKHFGAGSNQAANALTNLGRVAQDAPFGFIGIQNNLNPLLESFQQLRKESGSNSAALKALGQSLIGPAGIGIALSVVSAGILLYQKYIQGASKETEKAAQTNEDYVESLGAVRSAQTKGGGDAQKEITDLKILFDAYTNANLPLKKRQEAYAILQKEYPAYFANLKFEKEASEKTEDAYKRLSLAILATGKARAAADLIAKNSTAILIKEQQIIDETAKLDQNAKEKAAQAEKNRQEIVQKGLYNSEAAISANQAKQQEFDKKAAAGQQRINQLLTEKNVLTERNLQLSKLVTDEILKGADLPGTPPTPDAPKVADPTFKALKGFSPIPSIAASPLVSAPLKAPPIDFGATKESIATFSKSMVDFTAELTALMNNGLIGAFNSLGEAIGNALATGANLVDAIGASLLASIGDTLVQFGKLTIAAGVAALGLSAALTNPTPAGAAAAIAAGVALVAVGSAVRSFSSNVAKNGVGGGGGGSNFKPSVPSGFEASAPAGARATPRQDTFTLNTVIKGQDLALSLTRTQALNGRTG